jgi:signal transduction histidine kinase
VARLRRKLERERVRRLTAESLGEDATAKLYESVRELRAIQAALLEQADRERVVAELVRDLRQELDPQHLLTRGAQAAGTATGADRAQVHLVHPTVGTGEWRRDGVDLPEATGWPAMPTGLLMLLEDARAIGSHVVVTDADVDERLGDGQHDVRRMLGVRGLLAAPMRVGNLLVGWVVAQSTGPRTWDDRDLAVCQGLATELGSLLMQASTFEQQRASMLRLEDLDRTKDDFISNVSHELRTPLTSISGYLELIEDGELGPLSDEARHAVDVIGRNAGRLRALVEDLLTLSTYDSAGISLDREAVALWQVVEDCHGALLPTLARRSLQIDLRPTAGLPRVDADPTQLQRIILNLLTNAVKFTPDGGRVTIAAEQTGDEVALTVSDTGIGIPREEQDRVFSRFFRSSLSMASETQGTGLGLALTRALVEEHGGRIEISSEQDLGTTVRVTLPAAVSCRA